jgi:hypothetical protein
VALVVMLALSHAFPSSALRVFSSRSLRGLGPRLAGAAEPQASALETVEKIVPSYSINSVDGVNGCQLRASSKNNNVEKDASDIESTVGAISAKSASRSLDGSHKPLQQMRPI